MNVLNLFGKKLKLEAYSSNSYSGFPVETMELQINPEKIMHKHDVTYYQGKEEAFRLLGQPGGEPKFSGIKPEIIKFDFFLDATGVVGGVNDIVAEIKKFKKCAYDYHGDIHGPYYLKLTWGKLFSDKDNRVFRCRLTDLDINYTLFQSNGTPLRAELECDFMQYISEEEILAAANRSSPDLSHLITIKEGDRLPLLCHDIYGDSSYYLQIAKINSIVNFNRIAPGTKVLFPPLEK